MNRRTVLTGLAGLAVLEGCGRVRSSRLNPFNWFGRSSSSETLPETTVEAVDPRPLVETVAVLRVEPTPGGAIVRATGLPRTQGWHTASLVTAPTEDPAEVEFQFRAMPPARPENSGSPASRELVVAAHLTRQELSGVRRVRVVGERNILTVSR